MKKILITISLTIMSINICLATDITEKTEETYSVIQNIDVDTNKVFDVFEVDKMPEFPGGMSEMYKFIGKNLIYPPEMTGNFHQIPGKVYCRFIIEEDGSISNIIIFKSTVTPNAEKEAIRVIELMPKWIPAEKNGKKVRCYFKLPINFKLQ